MGGLHGARGRRARRLADRAARPRLPAAHERRGRTAEAPHSRSSSTRTGSARTGRRRTSTSTATAPTGQRSTEGERDLLYWVLSSLMVAEERISTQFCGLVLAQDDEEEGSFLSTQLVDEVRHMQFYARFQNEVIADPAAIARARRARARGARASRSGRSSTRRSWTRTTGCAATRATARRRSTS